MLDQMLAVVGLSFVFVIFLAVGRTSRLDLLGRRYTFPPHRELTLRLAVGDVLYGLRSLLYGLSSFLAVLTALWAGYRWMATLRPADPWRFMHGPVPIWAPGIPWQQGEWAQYIVTFVVCYALAALLKRPALDAR